MAKVAINGFQNSASNAPQPTGIVTGAELDRAARQGRNPATGATIQIAASKQPRFKAGKGLKSAVNG
jgi:hypothetical protein